MAEALAEDEEDRRFLEREARERARVEKAAWREVIDTVVENNSVVPDNAREEIKFIEQTSQKLRFIQRMAEVAVSMAQAKGLRPGSAEADDLVDRAAKIGANIANTFGGYRPAKEYATMSDAEAQRAFSMTSTAAPLNLLYDVEKHGPVQVDRRAFDLRVSEYLDSEFRDAEVERTLLCAAAEMEITAFIHSMVEKDYFTKKSRLQAQNVTAGARCFKNRLIALGVTAVTVAALITAFDQIPGMPEPVALGLIGLAGLCILGFVGYTVVSGVVVYRKADEINAPRNKTLTLIREAGHFFNEFRSPMLLSVPQYRSRVEELKALGMVWPQALWAILDDLDQRGVRRL